MANPPKPGAKPKAPRVVKPKTAYVVLEGISQEQLKGANPQVILTDSDMLAFYDRMEAEGKTFARVKVTIPVKARKVVPTA